MGNWSYPCQSHYWIEQNEIEWASKWSHEKIAANRARDRADRERYLKSRSEPETTQAPVARSGRGLMDRVRGLFRR